MKRGKLILLLLLLVLIAGYFILRSRSAVEKQKPIFAADSTRIARIEIDKDGQSIVFSKAKDHWSITEPIQWDVENDRFKLFWQQVLTQKYATTPIAEGNAAIEQYQLGDSLALRIKVWDNKDHLRSQVYFSNLNNPWDYFRYQGDDRIYQIRQKVASTYTPDLAGWRSPSILSIQPDQLSSIEVTHTKNSYALTRSGSIWHYKDAREEFDIPAGNTTMGKIQNLLARLDSYKVLDKGAEPPQEVLSKPLCVAGITLTDQRQIRISFYQTGKNYLMTVDNHPGMYFEIVFDTVFRFTRHAALFRAKVGVLPEV